MDLTVARRAGLRAAPYAVVLAVALAGALVLGAHLSNAQPSASRPFGWDGPAKFTNGVAMVRDDLVVAVSLPALLLGVRAVGDHVVGRDGVGRLAAAYGVHAAVLALAVAAATVVGAYAADSFVWRAVGVFVAAHALLAVAFLAVGFLASAAFGRPALATAGAAWLFLVLVFERLVRLGLYRTVGYDALLAGRFPTWFYAAQVGSPVEAYRGVLILGERGFMDYLERVALGDAVLPGYVNAGTFAAALAVVWIALPFGLGSAAWWWRARPRPAGATSPEPAA